MARGTLQLAWINRGEAALEPQYHVMYSIDGDNRTTRARHVRGKETLTRLLEADFNFLPDRMNKIMSELQKGGSSSVAGLNIPDTDLQRLELA